MPKSWVIEINCSKSTVIFLPIEFLPLVDESRISEKQLIGFKVIDINLGELGKITCVNSETAQQLIYVSKDESKFCFPMHEQFILGIDTETGIMKVEIPEEFLTLN